MILQTSLYNDGAAATAKQRRTLNQLAATLLTKLNTPAS